MKHNSVWYSVRPQCHTFILHIPTYTGLDLVLINSDVSTTGLHFVIVLYFHFNEHFVIYFCQLQKFENAVRYFDLKSFYIFHTYYHNNIITFRQRSYDYSYLISDYSHVNFCQRYLLVLAKLTEVFLTYHR